MKARLRDAVRDSAADAMKIAPGDMDLDVELDAAERTPEARTVVVVSADVEFRLQLCERLAALRWRVWQASGGAEALLQLESQPVTALLLDGWLPDLEVREFAAHVRLLYPEIEQLHLDGAAGGGDEPPAGPRSSWRNELLHTIREAKEGAANRSPVRRPTTRNSFDKGTPQRGPEAYRSLPDGTVTDGTFSQRSLSLSPGRWLDVQETVESVPVSQTPGRKIKMLLPELVGDSPAMREMARLVHLVAPRSTMVLIEGETGTGKEVVARALHRLSTRSGKPFGVLNCAAIPESLLEAELFGHTRGAFTGAVQSRMGRIEAADGGTLLLDEIGEMPVGMQAKMLRFLESGELQRVGGNEMTRVDVRLIAATHQPLEQQTAEGTFRLDLYHRLAVFPIQVPALRERMEDIHDLSEFFLDQLGQQSPRKRLAPGAAEKLLEHSWPGNVRELMHVLERAVILAGANPEISAEDIRYRSHAQLKNNQFPRIS
jgi:DNA-binding NtrC family response regulator